MEDVVMRRLAEALRRVERESDLKWQCGAPDEERLISVMADKIATAIEEKLNEADE